LHIYRAHEFALRYLETRGALASGGVVHSYSGARDFVPRYVDLNLHLSFAGALTRPNAKRPLDALRAVPRERLLLETDCPDQTPSGASANRNEPAELLRIAAVVARELGVSLDALAQLTTQNARALFGAA
jgi:TatD DNase family protein